MLLKLVHSTVIRKHLDTELFVLRRSYSYTHAKKIMLKTNDTPLYVVLALKNNKRHFLAPDANEDATRKRQRRLMMQREQAERSKQRLEQKVKHNEWQQQLTAKKDR